MKTLSKFLFTTSMLLILSTNLIAQKVGSTFTKSPLKYKITSLSPRTVAITGRDRQIERLFIRSNVEYKGETYLVTKIEDNAFAEMDELKAVSIPNSVIEIGENAFEMCMTLLKIKIPSSVKLIGKRAFGSCYNLQDILILSSEIKIGESAFERCEKLFTISLVMDKNIDASLDGENIFQGCTATNKQLFVPIGTVETYKNSPWAFYFTDKIKELPNIENN